jgi:pimeloyl-ACP methyl ester carboxylesterase
MFFLTTYLIPKASSRLSLETDRANASEPFGTNQITLGGYVHHYSCNHPQDENAPVVVGVHGFGTSGFRTFRHVARLLEDAGVRIFAPDLLGFGRSDKPDVRYSLDLYSDLLAEFCDKLSLRDPVILGHSMGGKIAAASVVRHPDRYRGLILANPGGFAPSERMIPFFAAHPLFHRLLRTDWFYHGVLPRTMLGPIFHSEENRLQMARLRESHVLLDLKRTGYLKRLSSVHIPTLVLWGMNDRVLPFRTSRRILQHLPDAHLRHIPNAGHAPMKDQPETFAREVSVFAKEILQ